MPEAAEGPARAGAGEPVGAELLWEGEVAQRTHAEHILPLRKERWRVEGEVPLVMVRKHLPEGPTRPPVLLVHGFAQNRYSWHTSYRSLSAWLAWKGFDTWNLELRGHGRSRDEGQVGAERFADYVDDVRRAAGALPDRAFWMGHSLGGACIYGAAAEQHSAGEPLPRGLVGVAAIYHFGQTNWLIGGLGRVTHRLRNEPFMHKVQIRTRLFGRVISRLYGLSDAVGYTVPASGWWPGSIEPELLEERLKRGFDWTSVKVWQEMSRWAAEGRFEYDAQWRELDVPFLCVLADRDHLLPPEDGRVAFERSGSSDKELLLFDDWHHEVHWGHLDLLMGKKAPEHVWPAMEAWMAARSG